MFAPVGYWKQQWVSSMLLLH